ncbi:hypothetical protein BDW22DRAFT_845727 [Trametopsis cervina]|nr:hypothetical protein BDW22DRAFT_845727 [Trametopsis cervina]
MIALGTIEDAVKVVKFLKEFIDDWKNAPDEIKLLKSQATAVETLLRNLATHQPGGLDKIPEEGSEMEGLGGIVRRHLDQIEKFLEGVQMKRPYRAVGVKKRVWLRKKIFGGGAKELSSQLANVQNVLNTIASSALMQANAQQEQMQAYMLLMLQAIESDSSAMRKLLTPAPPVSQPCHEHDQCSEGHGCVYHSTTATDQVIPGKLAAYLGQTYISAGRTAQNRRVITITYYFPSGKLIALFFFHSHYKTQQVAFCSRS